MLKHGTVSTYETEALLSQEVEALAGQYLADLENILSLKRFLGFGCWNLETFVF